MKTSRIKLENQRNENHFQLQTEFFDLVNTFKPDTLNIQKQFAEYLPFYMNEQAALDLILKSNLTEEIVNADNERDHVFRGFADAVKSATNHFDAGKQAAAHRLSEILKHYGNIANKSFDAQTAATNDLLRELATPANLADITALQLNDWIVEMDKKNSAFDVLMKKRYTDVSGKTDLRMQPTRAEVDKAFRGILDRLDALMLINGEAKYAAFVTELNARIDRYNQILVQEKGHREAKNEKLKDKNEE